MAILPASESSMLLSILRLFFVGVDRWVGDNKVTRKGEWGGDGGDERAGESEDANNGECGGDGGDERAGESEDANNGEGGG